MPTSDDGSAAAGGVAWSGGQASPQVPVPDGATDCHFHVYDARHPVAAEAVLRHGDASVEDYRALQRRLGTARGVLVQPSAYGTDNRLHLAALQDLGTERFRMVAVVEPGVADAELRRLHAAGARRSAQPHPAKTTRLGRPGADLTP